MNVLQSAEFISNNSENVSIDMDQIPVVGDWILKQMIDLKYSTKTWSSHQLHPKSKNEDTVNWIFLVDLLNFSFWNTIDFVVTLDSQTYTGYWTLCALINKNIRIIDPKVYSILTLEQLREIFVDDNGMEMAMLEERLKVMNEAGKILLKKYQGSFINVLKLCNYSCQELLRILITDFNSIWNDVGIYKSRPVKFLKRAQILIADLWAAFDGNGYGRFDDIDTITIFADYRIPQALVSLKILKYSNEATDTIKNTTLEHNSDLEMEIRGNSIWAINLIQEYMKKKSKIYINAILIDFYIWDYITKDRKYFANIPFHKTRSIYY